MGRLEIVHPVPVDEIVGWLRAVTMTFLEDPAEGEKWAPAFAYSWVPERNWGARDSGQWVATLRTLDRRLSVPGPDGGTVDIAADALSAVTVLGTHRRRSILTAMLTDSLAQAKARGDAVSILVAAEWPIYGRFGYWPSVESADYVYATRERGADLSVSPTGRLRQVDAAELQKVAPGIFDRARLLRAGHITRSERWWTRHLRTSDREPPWQGEREPFYVVHEGDDGPDGYVAWVPSAPFQMATNTSATVDVPDLIAANDAAYVALWHYLANLDLVGELTAPTRPVDEPLQWLLGDGRTLRQTSRGDRLWLRLLDVPAALSARRYATPGRVVFEVVDEDVGGYGSGRFRLDGGPDHAECVPTTESADLRVSQRALAGAYLGGFSLRSFMIAGLLDELTPGALARADAMFATALKPWLGTGF